MQRYAYILILSFLLLGMGRAQQTVAELVATIPADKTSPADQSQWLYQWIAQHIDYDVQIPLDLESAEWEYRQSTAYVLAHRKAVCQGYAQLYGAALDELDITNIIVSGEARAVDRDDLESHVWNAIRTDAGWLLADVTWGAGYIREGDFQAHYRSEWYDRSPQKMVLTHIPDDPMLQMMDTPISYTAFLRHDHPTAIDDPIWWQDSLDQLVLLLPEDRVIRSAMRALSWNPENGTAYYELGIQHFERAMEYAQSYEHLRDQCGDQTALKAHRIRLRSLLDAEQKCLEQSRLMFERLDYHSDNYNQTAEENLKVIRNVTRNISFEYRLLDQL